MRTDVKEQVPLGILRLLSSKLMTRNELRESLSKDSCSSIDHALRRLTDSGLVERVGYANVGQGRHATMFGVSAVLRGAPTLQRPVIQLTEKDSEKIVAAIRPRLS